MKTSSKSKCQTSEKLIRVRTMRRRETVFLRVHYGKSVRDGCTTLRILKIESVE